MVDRLLGPEADGDRSTAPPTPRSTRPRASRKSAGRSTPRPSSTWFGRAACWIVRWCRSAPITCSGQRRRAPAMARRRSAGAARRLRCNQARGRTGRREHPKHLIVRTCGLYARPSDPRAANFVKTMLRLGSTRSELSRRRRSILHADLRAAPGSGDPASLASGGSHSPAGRCALGNLSCDQHRPNHLARVGRRDLSPGGHASRGSADHYGRVRRGGARVRRTACSIRRPIIGSAARPCRIGKRR